MRLIKFRAWAGRMFRVTGLGYDEFAKLVMIGDNTLEPGCRWMDAKEVKLMQFTGLHDKNGKEIWEGDILKFKETIAYDPEEFQERTQSVTFMGGAFSPIFLANWVFHDEDDKPMRIWDVEVLGNIYENPELLK